MLVHMRLLRISWKPQKKEQCRKLLTYIALLSQVWCIQLLVTFGDLLVMDWRVIIKLKIQFTFIYYITKIMRISLKHVTLCTIHHRKYKLKCSRMSTQRITRNNDPRWCNFLEIRWILQRKTFQMPTCSNPVIIAHFIITFYGPEFRCANLAKIFMTVVFLALKFYYPHFLFNIFRVITCVLLIKCWIDQFIS